jgi:hypothetical protein
MEKNQQQIQVRKVSTKSTKYKLKYKVHKINHKGNHKGNYKVVHHKVISQPQKSLGQPPPPPPPPPPQITTTNHHHLPKTPMGVSRKGVAPPNLNTPSALCKRAMPLSTKKGSTLSKTPK